MAEGKSEPKIRPLWEEVDDLYDYRRDPVAAEYEAALRRWEAKRLEQEAKVGGKNDGVDD